MSDSTTEGVLSAIAKRHAVNVKKAQRWNLDGMPLDLAEAENWLRQKQRGKFKPDTPGSRGTSRKQESAFAEILAEGDAAVSGPAGMFARACALEIIAYQTCKADASASNLNAYASAQKTVAVAADAVAKHEIDCQRLVDADAFKRALQTQDGACMSLGTSMPYAVVDLLVDQPREAIIEALQNWWTNVFFAKRRETAPFREGVETVDVDAMLDEAEKEADADE